MQTNTATKQNKVRSLPLVLILLILLCFSVLLNIPTISRWLSQNDGYADVEVAIFAADAGSSSGSSMLLDKSENITVANYSFWVTNTENDATSEVASNYTVIIDLPQVLPEGIGIKIDDIAGTVSNGGKTYTFTNADWIFEPGVQETKTHTLSFTADFDLVEDDFSTTGISIKVKVSQSN